MTATIIILISIAMTFLTHVFIAATVGDSVKKLYKFYGQDDMSTAYFIFLSAGMILMYSVFLCALNNTYFHFPY